LRYVIVFFFFYIPLVSSQDIIGNVKASNDLEALNGANVILSTVQKKRGEVQSTITDIDGSFKLEKIKSGRYILSVSYTGYKTFTCEEFLLEGETINFEKIILEARNYNPTMYSVGIGDDYEIIYCVEDDSDIPVILDHHPAFDNFSMLGNTLRVYQASSELAGTFDDPSRVLYRTPGISLANDQANGIVYRGLAPDNIKWTVEGAEIVNPNHLSNAGSLSDQSSASAGGVLAVPFNVISTFSFNGQPYSSDLVNSISGVSDLRFNSRPQRFLKLGLLGMEASVSNEKGLNFQLHGRYSTVGLLSDLGVDFDGESIKFQDLFFQVKLTEHLKLTNILASSSNFHAPLEDVNLASNFKDLNEIDFQSRINIHGLSYSKNNMEHHLFFSQKKDERSLRAYPDYIESRTLNKQTKLSYRGKVKLNSLSFQLLSTLSDNVIDYENSDFDDAYLVFEPSVNNHLDFKLLDRTAVFRSSAALSYFSYYNEVSPQLSLSLQISTGENSLIDYSSSLVSQMQDPYIYGIRSQNGAYVNLDLDRKSTIANSIGFKYNAAVNILTRVFYQSFFSLPNSSMVSPVINGIPFDYRGELLDIGKARTYGVEFMIDKEINGYYINLNATLFKTKFLEYNATNSFGFINNISLSKTYVLKNNKILKIATASHFRGGAYVNNVLSPEYFQTRLSDYFRIDLRVSYEWKKNNLTLDIQNLTNRLNDAYYYYEALIDDIALEKQLGTIPILSFKRFF